MLLDHMEARTAEKTLLLECLDGTSDTRIMLHQIDAALADQGMQPYKRIEIKEKLRRIGMLVPPER